MASRSLTSEQREHKNAYQRKYYAEHRERIKEKNRNWAQRNTDYIRSYKHEHYLKKKGEANVRDHESKERNEKECEEG